MEFSCRVAICFPRLRSLLPAGEMEQTRGASAAKAKAGVKPAFEGRGKLCCGAPGPLLGAGHSTPCGSGHCSSPLPCVTISQTGLGVDCVVVGLDVTEVGSAAEPTVPSPDVPIVSK